jgi:hypothetical protein
MWKRLGFSLLVPLAALLMMAGAPQAQAGVHFGIAIGVPPVYPPPAYPYVSPYPYPNAYAYPAPVYSYPYGYYGYWDGHPDYYRVHHGRAWHRHESRARESYRNSRDRR